MPVVGLRQPCPCGSGRRYKACHGRREAQAGAPVTRPFAGLPAEADWVALRELVPAATAPLRLRDAVAGADGAEDARGPQGTTGITVTTVLPDGWAALARADGQVFVALQAAPPGSDLSRSAAAALVEALQAAPGTPVPVARTAPSGPRLQDLLDLDAPLEVAVHRGFDFWLAGTAAPTPEVAAALERANASVVPTARLTSVAAAYWAGGGSRHALRWVLPVEEETALDAMARLRAAGADSLVEGSRLIGSFRAHGLVVPVWDLPRGTSAAALEEPAARYASRLSEALEDPSPLTPAQRSARAGLLTRQLTLR